MAPALRGLLLAILLLVPAHARAVAPDPWDAVLSLAAGAGDVKAAEAELVRLIALGRVYVNGRDVDVPTREALARIAEKLETLDAESLYVMLPPFAERPVAHGLSVYGWIQGQEAYRVSSAPRGSPVRFGDGILQFGLTPAPGQRFAWTSEVRAHVGIDAQEMSRYAGAWLDWLSARTVAREDKGERWGSADKEALDALTGAFPSTSAMVLRYVKVLDLVEPRPVNGRVRLHSQVDREVFAADYPKLAEVLFSGRATVRTRARLVDARGRTLAVAKMDSKARENLVVFEPRVGAFSHGRYEVFAELDADISGLELRITGLHFTLESSSGPRGWVVRSAFDRVPEVKLSGAVLGVIPLGVVDALIPSDLESITRAFFEGLAATDKGRGAWTESVFPVEADGAISATSRAEMVSNGFVTFALRFGRRRLGWNDATNVEMRTFATQLLDAFASDLQRRRQAHPG